MKDIRLILLALATATALDAQTYAIHLDRPERAGQSYTVSGTGSSIDQLLVGGRVQKSSEYQVTFKGRAEVLEIDDKGQAFRLAFTVESLTKTEGGATVDLIQPGIVILDDGSQKEPISVKSGTLTESAREAFHLVHSTHKPNDTTDDEIFGTKGPKKIGDSWSINLARASEDLKDTGIDIPLEHMSGTISIVAKDNFNAIDCLSIQGEIRGDSFLINSPLDGRDLRVDLPPGVTMDRGSLQAKFHGCLPVDNSEHSFKRGIDMTTQFRATSKEGVNVEFKNSRTSDVVWLAVGK